MSISRRDFLASLAATGLTYGFRVGSSSEETTIPQAELRDSFAPILDYTHWIKIQSSGKVRVFVGRAELGQGLLTSIYSLVSQGLDLAASKIKVYAGDTALCPDDGATGGSTTTVNVSWPVWLACLKIRQDALMRAAAALEVPADELTYRHGVISAHNGASISIFDFHDDDARLITIDPSETSDEIQYTDPGFLAVDARKIVTGKIKFTGDLKMKRMVYGSFLTPDYHKSLTKLLSANLDKARKVAGVYGLEMIGSEVAATADNYTSLQKALSKVKAKWQIPAREKTMNHRQEILQKAKLQSKAGNLVAVQKNLEKSDLVLTEMYETQYATTCPLETDTAVAEVKGNQATVYCGSQYSAGQRRNVKNVLGFAENNVRVIGQRSGGAFGGKAYYPVAFEAAKISRQYDRPVKYYYSRSDQFKRRGQLRTAALVRITLGCASDGKLLAQKLENYQDGQNAGSILYSIPSNYIQRFASAMPTANLAWRAVGYLPAMFACESHIDQMAHRLDIDPLEMRLRNISNNILRNTLETCAKRFGYSGSRPGKGRGIGISLALWGQSRGTLMVEVRVNEANGAITLEKICFVADVGVVVSGNTARANLSGGIIMGISHSLMEEVEIDGYGIITERLGEYRIPRFSDLPDIDITFVNSENRTQPWQLGELPVPPVSPAIANAVFNATGARILETPITASKLKKALAG